MERPGDVRHREGDHRGRAAAGGAGAGTVRRRLQISQLLMVITSETMTVPMAAASVSKASVSTKPTGSRKALGPSAGGRPYPGTGTQPTIASARITPGTPTNNRLASTAITRSGSVSGSMADPPNAYRSQPSRAEAQESSTVARAFHASDIGILSGSLSAQEKRMRGGTAREGGSPSPKHEAHTLRCTNSP
jgi:hypothetical protein